MQEFTLTAILFEEHCFVLIPFFFDWCFVLILIISKHSKSNNMKNNEKCRNFIKFQAIETIKLKWCFWLIPRFLASDSCKSISHYYSNSITASCLWNPKKKKTTLYIFLSKMQTTDVSCYMSCLIRHNFHCV